MVLGRIVEVNGVNVNQENHKQVVARIKSIENETKLLGIVQKSDWCNVIYGILSPFHFQTFATVASQIFWTKIPSVVDKTCEDYHKEKGIVVRGNLPYVVLCSNKVTATELLEKTNDNEDVIDTRNALI